jgi:hypothetical protein
VTVTPVVLADNATVAVAVFVVSATLVAVMVTVCEDVIELGAVYNPEGEIVPTGELSDQVTAVFVVPDTEAVNCWVCDAPRVAEAGLMEIETLEPGVTVRLAPALFVGSAALTAVTMIVC